MGAGKHMCVLYAPTSFLHITSQY